jgi:predicted nucleic acid-binding protein
MAGKVILVDTSILIDYYRKTDKVNTTWVKLIHQGYEFAISTVTKYEIFTGVTPNQSAFWNSVLKLLNVMPFTENAVDKAVDINSDLKRIRKQIAIPDLFIAATAVANDLPLATLNKKHFDRVTALNLVILS